MRKILVFAGSSGKDGNIDKMGNTFEEVEIESTDALTGVEEMERNF